MTLVITILASDNARNRRRQRRAEAAAKQQSDQQIDRLLTKAVARCNDRVLKAASMTEYKMKMRSKPIKEAVSREKSQYRKVTNEAGRQIHAVQKQRGKSQPPRGVI